MGALSGRRLGRYEVTSLLGAGGMGEVYRARDAELEREVAIKVLPDGARDNPDRLDRFAREARAVARLSHPNILEIFDVGQHDGVHYAVTELLEGRTLRDHLHRGRLPVRRALAVAEGIARGLGAAHAQGVVHRDVKPANILITTDGRVKVLDFGIASLHEPETPGATGEATDTSTVTATGSLIGTAGYMSPEQVRGNKADARSDVFALGCVIFEMLTGQCAFRRGTAVESLAAVLHDEPPLPSSLAPEIPPGIDNVVLRCLEKEPGERFQSAADVAFALRAAEGGHRPWVVPRSSLLVGFRRRLLAIAVGAAVVVGSGLALRYLTRGPPPLPEDKHLAILPLQSQDDDPALQQLALGLTENLADGLRLLEHQTFGEFWLVSAREHRADDDDIRAVFHQHNVSLALTGHLATMDRTLVLDLVLHDARTSRVLREIRIEDSIDNLESFQQAPVAALVDALDLELTEETAALLERRRTTVVSSFVSYLRGIGLATSASDLASLESAAGLLQQAVDSDPANSCARCALGVVAARLVKEHGLVEWGPRGLELLRPALEPETAAARATQAAILSVLGDSESAIRALEAAVASAPANAEIQVELARTYAAAKRRPDAEAAFQRAISLRPGYWEGHHLLAFNYFSDGRYHEAANAWRAAITCAPRSFGMYTNLGIVLYYMDRHEDARKMLEKSFALKPDDNWWAVANLGTLYFEEARFAEAAEMFERALEINADDYRTWGNLGHCYAVSADPTRAESPLRKAVELGARAIENDRSNLRVLADVAGYYAILGERPESVDLLDRAAAANPEDPEVLATIGEAYEDLGDRGSALLWIGRALGAGIPSSRFERRPSLRELISDPAYSILVERAAGIESKPD